MKRMIVDTPNMLFRVAAAHGRYGNEGSAEEKAGLAMHIALNTLLKYYKQYKPDQLAVAFEGKENWRKDYTKSNLCISKKIYKANRVKDPSMIPFFELIASFEQLVREHTSLVCLSANEVEGDDMIAGYVQRFAPIGDDITIVSGDRDFKQLLKYPNVKLINPDDGKPRECEDVDFFMFEKCMRGDSGDNVASAYPRVRKTRLEKAFNDEYELTQLMNEEFEFNDPDTGAHIKYQVADLFAENNLLMNLECQPNNIREIIEKTLDHELLNHGHFSFFHLQKFCGKYGLKQIAENMTPFVDMFSITGRLSPVREQTEAIRETKKQENSALSF